MTGLPHNNLLLRAFPIQNVIRSTTFHSGTFAEKNFDSSTHVNVHPIDRLGFARPIIGCA